VDAVRLALGTFTVLPVRPPSRVDARTAGRAMLLAPLVGVLLGGLGAVVLEAGRSATRHSVWGELLASVATLAVLAWATRGLHLDGLADTVDGLGARLPREQALAAMRRPDVGAFGAAALVLVLLTQAAALAAAVNQGFAWLAVVVAVTTGRLAATWGCVRGVPSARPEGLGAAVAGTVPRAAALLTSALVLAGAVGAAALDDDNARSLLLRAGVAVVAGVTGALLVRRAAVRRLGGITGDTLGALVETATTLALIAFALG